MRITAAGMSHQGRHREHNEDQFLVSEVLGLYAVADGVESEPYGELASKMAVQELEKAISAISSLDQDATPPFEYASGIPLPARALKFAFREANRKIYEKANSDPKFKGMCSTLTAVWATGGKVFVGNVGDSRAYLIRGARPLQLTRDHTMLAQGDASLSLAQGEMEEYSSASEHALTKAMGVNPDLEVQLAGGTPKPGDVIVLCTDGLYEEVRDFEIVDAVREFEPALAAKKLITLANQRGGRDNIALVVIKFD